MINLGDKNWGVKDSGLLAYKQVGSKYFNKDFDFTRASNGTYIDKNGVLQTAELYNLIPYSEDFTQWAITASGTTLSESLLISPDGQKHAYKLEADGSNLFARVDYSISITNGSNVFYSLYVKQSGTHNDAYIRLDGTGIDGSQNNATYQFDFSTESISKQAGGDAVSTLVQDVGNGWYRIGIEVSNTTITKALIYPAFNDANGGEILIYGAQLVEGTQRAYQYTNGLQGLPRISFEDGVGHLLLEPQRSNLIPYSEDFSQWSASGNMDVPILVSEISPSGENQCGFININNAASSTKFNYLAFSTTSNIHSQSVFIKYHSRQWFQFASGGTAYYANFDIQNGVIGNVSACTATIEDYGNGWYKCSITTTSAVAPTNYAIVVIDSDTASRLPNSTGLGSYYVWGAQMEVGNYVSSYIKSNSGTSVTRLADVCNNSGSAQDFNSEEGVLYAEVAALEEGQDVSVIALSDNSLSNRILIAITGGEIRGQYVSSGHNNAIDSSGLIVENFNKIACVYTPTTFKVFLNGSQIGSTISITTPVTGLSKVAFDRGDGGLDFNGKTRNLQVFTEALSDAELQKLTT